MLIAKWILQSRKKRGTSEVDPLNFPIREQGPETGLISSLKYYSKTRIDKNRRRTPSDAHPTSQQKRHSTKSALKNGGPEGTRTPDLLRVKQALYQLSYRSEN